MAGGLADDLTASTFAAQVNRTFTAQSLASIDAATFTIRLRSVEPLQHTAPALAPELAQERSFMLVFDVEGPAAAQDTYRIVNGAIRPFAALLVPARKGTVLTAVFNRLA